MPFCLFGKAGTVIQCSRNWESTEVVALAENLNAVFSQSIELGRKISGALIGWILVQSKYVLVSKTLNLITDSGLVDILERSGAEQV